jgi:hypothetical protein
MENIFFIKIFSKSGKVFENIQNIHKTFCYTQLLSHTFKKTEGVQNIISL